MWQLNHEISGINELGEDLDANRGEKKSIKSGESLSKVNLKCCSRFSRKCKKLGWSSRQLALPSSLWNSAVSLPFCTHTDNRSRLCFLYCVLLLITSFSDGRLEGTRRGWDEQVKTFHRSATPRFGGANSLYGTKVAWKWNGESHRVDTITVLRIRCEHRMWDKRAILKEISADTSQCLSMQWSHCASYCAWEAFCHLYHSKWERENRQRDDTQQPLMDQNQTNKPGCSN